MCAGRWPVALLRASAWRYGAGLGAHVKVCNICRARFRGDPTYCPLDGGQLADLPDPLLGRVIAGRYTIREKIGAGGMGTVYRAYQDVVGRDVAIKFLAPELAMDPTNRQRFLREAKAANRINHEHIIDITDFGETDDGLVYLVMEYLDGTPLNVEIANGPMAPERAMGIALQSAQALARAHELDVIHRDIKPDNIYLLRGYATDFVKILDFGLAKMKGELKLTATGTVFGTPEYMAPEQARGVPVTFSVDLYALGCVLFEMLTEQLPFTGTTPDLILKHMREPARRASVLAPKTPKGLDDLVLRLLSKKPEERHHDAYQLADDLHHLLEELGAHRTAAELDQTHPFAASVLAQSRVPAPSPAPSPPLSQTVSTEDAWDQRLDIFRDLIGQAHPAGDAPAWLVPSIEDLAGRVLAMRRLRKELDMVAAQSARREQEMREARLRIGRALDELGSDESRVVRQLQELRAQAGEAQARLQDLEKPLLRAWAAIPPLPASGPSLDRQLVEDLRNAGNLASIWLEAQRSLATFERDLVVREREREDLLFQIAQLKGRNATADAEDDLDAGSLRQSAASLDSGLRRAVEDVVRKAEPVYKYFMQFPALRDMVITGHSVVPQQSESG